MAVLMLEAYRKLLAEVRARPLMYVDTASYSNLSAFINGCDVANLHGLLAGFHEWLVLKLDGYDEFFWTGQVLRHVFPDKPEFWHGSQLGPDENQVAVEALFDLLDEFLMQIGQKGKRALIHDYIVWLQEQPAYNPDVIRYGRSAPHVEES